MYIEQKLRERSGGACELCGNTNNLQVYAVPPVSTDVDKNILICHTCLVQILDPGKMDVNHWRCLNTSMWSTVPVVQVMAWRVLHELRYDGWPQDLLDMLYLDDKTLAWAKATVGDDSVVDEAIIHKDVNGTVLQTGD